MALPAAPGCLANPKGLLNAATGLALVLAVAWFGWDYLSAKEDAATLADRVEQWQARAGAWQKATRVQQEKAQRAQDANRLLRKRNKALRESEAGRERDYRREVKDDPKAQKWGATRLPGPVSDWLRDLAGRTPGVGPAGRTGAPDRDGGDTDVPPDGSGAGSAGPANDE